MWPIGEILGCDCGAFHGGDLVAMVTMMILGGTGFKTGHPESVWVPISGSGGVLVCSRRHSSGRIRELTVGLVRSGVRWNDRFESAFPGAVAGGMMPWISGYTGWGQWLSSHSRQEDAERGPVTGRR